MPDPSIPEWPFTLPITGETQRYAVRRIFCVGRNYAAHAAEMGNKVDRSAPFYFTKSACHLAVDPGVMIYPKGTEDCHHEVECVVALGGPVKVDFPIAAVTAVAVGLDMTRRDRQATAKEKRHPWDVAKDFEDSAIIGDLTPVSTFGDIGAQRLALEVNGTLRQAGHLSEMVWSVPELLVHLSGLYALGAGDLVMTGTPAGVGPVHPGDVLHATLDGAAPLTTHIRKGTS